MNVLGIEFGSTRIKSVLIDSDMKLLDSRSFTWENSYKNGYWTYDIADAQKGLKQAVNGIDFSGIKAIGISGMMHGLLAFDKNDNLLTPFRTWRNVTTTLAANKLSDVFDFHIPERWSVSHLYQDILDNKSYVGDIAFMTTLAGYIHYKLTGKKVLGIGDASGMFPIKNGEYNSDYLAKFKELTGINWLEIAPKPLKAGESAGALTKDGCQYLGIDQSYAGIPLCPPEGDMQTGMICTNSIDKNTGNLSAGTSINACIVLEKELKGRHNVVDVVSTPTGDDAILIHCNTCTAELDQWANLINDALELFGTKVDKTQLYTKLYNSALTGENKGIIVFNTMAGELILDTAHGSPMLIRTPDAKMSIGGVMKSQLFASVSTVKLGLDILKEKEGIEPKLLTCHGGLYKVKDVGAIITASALNVTVSISSLASEGGAFGIAILALYLVDNAKDLSTFLHNLFDKQNAMIYKPSPELKADFERYYADFIRLLPVQKKCVEVI